MGDTFSGTFNAPGGVVSGRGSQIKIVNRSGGGNGELRQALETIAAHLERHPDAEAKELFAQISADVAQGKKTSVLKAIWKEFKEILPHAAGVASAVRILERFVV